MAKKEQTTPKFPKEQILQANKYRNNVDVVNAVLVDGEKYTIEETDALINKYMKGKVN